MTEDKETYLDKKLRPLPRWIFMSRWLQAPLYIGLIVAQGVYVWQFWIELYHLISMMANKSMTETALMLVVLGLIHVNAGVLKVKLATAIIGISSIHLLKTFINAASYDEKTLMWQTLIHVTFVLSALAIAYTEKIVSTSHKQH